MPVCLLYVHSSSGPPLFRHLQIFMYSLFGFSTRAAPMIKNPMINIRVFIQDHLTSFRMILLSFVFLILTGAVLLCLPFASKGGEGVPFLNALFTSTSAACVTGLVVYDTATKWTLFGKIVIIVLIQIGGLGVVTAAMAIFTLTGKKIGLLPRIAIQDAVSAPQIGSILTFMKFLVAGTFCIEAVGALCLLPFFVGRFGLPMGLGYAVFHSVSAFCNAGFDLMGVQEPFSSLTSCPADISVNLTIMLLIILGGAGFLTWNDVLQQKRRIKKLRLQTKIILASTALLILLPFLYFFFIEFRSFSGTERLMLSLFQSVTPRTAGFNTFDYGKMSESGWLITILLMMIGGAPGSTAGGMKVTTMAVLLVSAKAYLRRKHEVDCFRRRIDTDVIHNAIALLTLYMGLLLVGTMIIANIEGLPVMVSMFECASALGTVGLTTGITTSLSAVSRILLICFMFFGRIGGLTLGYALASTVRKNTGRLPAENVSVG